MKAIDKIIFNELASRRAVVLPGLGTLGVARRTAQVDGDQVKAPVNEVVFSKNEAADAPSVIALMESMGLSRETARTAYKEWHEGVLRDDGFGIAGVGMMNGGNFTLSTELGQMLNPRRTRQTAKPDTASVAAPVPVPVPVPAPAPVPVQTAAGRGHTTPPPEKKKQGNRLISILLIIALLLLLAIICLCVVNKGCSFCGNNGKELTDANAAYDKAHGVTESTPAAPLQEVVAPEPVASSVSGNYHVIAGSFIYEANADQLIARYRREFPDLKVEKLITDAWVMVSVWQGETAGDGAAANRELQRRLDNYGMWVYRKK